MILPLWLSYALALLLVYRLTRLITMDYGPRDCCFLLRLKLGAYDLAPNGEPDTVLGRFIICPHCVSVWWALLASILLPTGGLFEWALAWGGIAGAVSLLYAREG